MPTRLDRKGEGGSIRQNNLLRKREKKLRNLAYCDGFMPPEYLPRILAKIGLSVPDEEQERLEEEFRSELSDEAKLEAFVSMCKNLMDELSSPQHVLMGKLPRFVRWGNTGNIIVPFTLQWLQEALIQSGKEDLLFITKYFPPEKITQPWSSELRLWTIDPIAEVLPHPTHTLMSPCGPYEFQKISRGKIGKNLEIRADFIMAFILHLLNIDEDNFKVSWMRIDEVDAEGEPFVVGTSDAEKLGKNRGILSVYQGTSMTNYPQFNLYGIGASVGFSTCEPLSETSSIQKVRTGASEILENTNGNKKRDHHKS